MDLLNLSTFELRQICYFLTVVDAGNSMSRAAERLNIDQPPVSQRIRSLEKQLKVKLFDRSTRPMQLTAAGEAFGAESRMAIAHLDRAITQSRQAQQGTIGSLRIGIASSIANSLLPELLQRFRQHYPDVKLDLHQMTAQRQIVALDKHQLDIGFEVMPDSVANAAPFTQLPVVTESLVLVLPVDHPLSNEKAIAMADLASEPLLLPSVQAFPFYQNFIQECHKAGFEPNLVETTTATWMLTLLGLVAAGMGLAILPNNVCVLERRGVVFRDISDLPLTRTISAVWRSDNSSVVLANFLEIVRSFQSSV